MATLDIRDFGAAVDGSTDDTQAIQDAIDAASSGDTVYFPSGTTRVASNGGSAVSIDGSIADDVTLRGDGEGTLVKMLDVSDSNNSWCIGIVADGDPITGLEIRDMAVSGNKAENGNKSAFGINVYPGGDGHDILIEDVKVFDCSGKGIGVTGDFVRLNRITSVGNTRHGVQYRIWTERPSGEWGGLATNIRSENNGGLGIDHNGGSARFERFWLENNGQGGAKVPRKVKESWWSTGSFVNNGTMGFRYNGDYTDQYFRPMDIHLDNVVARDNPWAGYWLGGDVNYDIGTIAAKGNNSSDSQHANLEVLHVAELDADTVYAEDAAEGAGLFYSSDGNSRIDTYRHTGNPSGGLSGDQLSNLAVADDQSGDCPTLDVPGRDEVGAWSSSTDTPEPTAVIQSSSGTISASNGVIDTK